jgi:ParB family chromosome partitioning protein
MTEKLREKPKHLGRGLESLLGPINSEKTRIPISAIDLPGRHKSNEENDLDGSFRHISLDLITPNPYQVRTVWNDQELEALADSIKANGLIQPVIVRKTGTQFELIAGERRYRAAQIASLEKIPAIVRQANEGQMLELALVENIHRTDLNPIERAKAYQNYMRSFSLTQTMAAQRLGEDRSVISNYLRLLDLPQEIAKMLIDGKLSMGHARAIIALPTDEIRRKIANRAMVGRLSVREIERLVRKYITGTEQSRIAIRSKPAHIIDLENKLSRQLGTKVNIETRKNGQRGKIVIEFYSIDEFDRITDSLGLPASETV